MVKNTTNNNFYSYYNSLNNSKLLLGISLLLINIGSKYIELEISSTQAEYIRNSIGRELLIFSMVFTGTRDIILSILLTSAFIILSNTIFNEKHHLCIIPEKYKKINNAIDTNNDNIITDTEIRKAEEILHKAKIQKHKELALSNYSKFKSEV